MHFSTQTVALWCLSVGGASAFSTPATSSVAFVGRSGTAVVGRTHSAGCVCPSCVSVHPSGCACVSCSRSAHTASCLCVACVARPGTALFADVAEGSESTEVAAEEPTPAEEPVVAEEAAVVPTEVEAMDGIESTEEAHNVERPARAQLKKKKPRGKDLAEFAEGSMVKGSVRSITNYGAFIDFGATTDGLLHISQLASGYVANVGDVLKEGEEIEVRIVSIDSGKGQVALSLMSEDEEANSQEAAKQSRPRQSNRRDDSATLASLTEKGWEPTAFVEGTVVSTVDFGCFVRVSAAVLNSECEGELDGLVHISALRNGRVNSVSDVVSVNEKVQVRVKSITGSKVSLTMLSVEDEQSKSENSHGGGGGQAFEGAKDWKESLEKFDGKSAVFTNRAVVEDRRK